MRKTASSERRAARKPAPFLIALGFGLLIGAAILTLVARAGAGGSASTLAHPVLKHVIDGDTIVLKGGTHVRYVGVDTPEKGEPIYREATEANRGLLAKGPLRLAVCPLRPRDKYGRTLAFVYAGDVDVSLELVKTGMGRVFSDTICLHENEATAYWKASRDAYVKRLGIWKDAPAAPLSPETAASALRRDVIVCGVVKHVHRSEKAFYLNFGEDWRKDFSAVIYLEQEPLFTAAGLRFDKSAEGKTLSLFGYMETREVPSMRLTSPGQVTTPAACQ